MQQVTNNSVELKKAAQERIVALRKKIFRTMEEWLELEPNGWLWAAVITELMAIPYFVNSCSEGSECSAAGGKFQELNYLYTFLFYSAYPAVVLYLVKNSECLRSFPLPLSTANYLIDSVAFVPIFLLSGLCADLDFLIFWFLRALSIFFLTKICKNITGIGGFFYSMLACGLFRILETNQDFGVSLGFSVFLLSLVFHGFKHFGFTDTEDENLEGSVSITEDSVGDGANNEGPNISDVSLRKSNLNIHPEEKDVLTDETSQIRSEIPHNASAIPRTVKKERVIQYNCSSNNLEQKQGT